MLVLSRWVGEALIINGNIRVVVSSVRGDKVRLGVEADPSIPVDREEVHKLRLKDANRLMAKDKPHVES